MIAFALLTALGAFGLLALASDRHRHRWNGVAIPWRRRGGWALVVSTFVAAFAAWGPVYGAIGALGLLMLGAGVSFLALNLTQR
ncbi:MULTISPECIES: DUF3325 family protein [unclassified Sphingomonas]|uniref:DUF3325 family protein n=1 Tax=unclassified Sphingomonas TaxID=196159 RepID=UPI0006FAFDE8|nr:MULTISPECIES: DUF3325 family protein [unclassified Sphingomonas]KQM66993.1 hypothetical protein ASE65_02775 [Sphingomonas sp. Leaf16]KQN17939.1 hypothetical protein ASE81_02155 [Sphingomonas sp. Leaf29]KQN23803.1 hypothetical protein ASE83_05035 [Sphingomonas sp. Leaf32]